MVAPAGSVVVTTRAPIGNVAVTKLPSATNQGCRTLVLDSRLDGRFLRYQLQVRVQDLQALGSGSTFLELSGANLGSLRVHVPALRTQLEIVSFLDRECGRIRRVGGLLADHHTVGLELERRVIDDLCTGVPFTRLGWRGLVQTGLTLGGAYTNEELVERPYLRVANVQADAIATTDVATVRVPARIARRTTLRRGDVLMTEGGDIDKLGRGAVWDGSVADCLHQNHVFAVRCGDRLLPEFLAVWTRSSVARSFFERTASRITNIASTNLTKLLRLPVPDLPIVDQEARLRAFEREHRRIVELREQAVQLGTGLAEYRDALITEAVTGKLDVQRLSGQQLDESVRGVANGVQPEILSA
jgi:type I restriction enzyme S subunit